MEELLWRPHEPRFQLQDINVESLFKSFAHVHTGFLQAYPCCIVHKHASTHASECAGVYTNNDTCTGMPEASWPQGIGGPWSERFSGYASLVACQPQEAKEVAEGNAQCLSGRQPSGGERLARDSTVAASPSTAEYVLHIEDVVPAIESFQVPCAGAGGKQGAGGTAGALMEAGMPVPQDYARELRRLLREQPTNPYYPSLVGLQRFRRVVEQVYIHLFAEYDAPTEELLIATLTNSGNDVARLLTHNERLFLIRGRSRAGIKSSRVSQHTCGHTLVRAVFLFL